MTDQRFALINRAELARRLKVSRELVSRWFRESPPGVPEEWLQAAAKATGLPAQTLRKRGQ